MAQEKQVKKDFSAGGILWDAEKKKIFLIKVKNLLGELRWTFPKGHPDPQEPVEEAALREVREETGWTAEMEQPLMDVRYAFTRAGQRYDKTVRWFLMRPLKEISKPDPKEVLAYQWCGLPEARRLVSYPSDIQLLTKLTEIVG